MRHKWFTVVLANVAMSFKASFAPEVTGELAAITVLDKNDMLAPREDLADLGRVKWNNPFDLKMVGHNSFLACEFLHSLENHAFGRTPADQCDRSVFRADKFWR